MGTGLQLKDIVGPAVKCKGCGGWISERYACQEGVDGFCDECMAKRGVCPECFGQGYSCVENIFVEPTPENPHPILKMSCKHCGSTGRV